MISWLLDSVEKSGVDPEPAIVVGFGADQVKQALVSATALRKNRNGVAITFILQKELLGTGHAVQQAEPSLKDEVENILVLYGDDPLISPETIKTLADTHLAGDAVITMATTRVSDFEGWRASFHDFGRIIRDENNRFVAIREIKDASEEERAIREVNPGIYCFRASWLWPHLEKLRNENVQGEYYLTDLVGMAISESAVVETLEVDPKECLGINSKEQLELVQELLVH